MNTLDILKHGLMRPLLGQIVTLLSHVALYTRDAQGTEHLELIDTDALVFTIADGRRFELMEAQQADLGIVVFTETPTDDDLLTSVDLERAPHEYMKAVAVDDMGRAIPWTVASITEVWRPDVDPPYLVAAILWDDAQRPLLSLYTAADEIAEFSLHDLQEQLLSLPFYYGSVLHHWYGG